MLRLHRRQNCLDEQEGRREVDLDRPPPFLGRDLLESRRQRQRRVVDQDVDAAESLERLPDDRVGDAGRGDIAGEGEGVLRPISRATCSARSRPAR